MKEYATLLLLMMLCWHVEFVRGNLSSMRKDECTYNFEVWTPNQDVQQKMRDLEQKCDNAATSLDREVAQLRSTLSSEMMKAMNLTHRVEKSLLEQRLQESQQSFSLQDIRHEMKEVRTYCDRVLTSVGGTSSSALTSTGSLLPSKPITDTSHERQHGHHQSDKLEGIISTMNQLKQNVGDLKAEWLMIKREVHNIEEESAQMKSGQSVVREDSNKIKNSVETLKSEIGRLKRKQEDLQSLSEKIKNTMGKSRSDSGGDVDVVDVMGKLNDITYLSQRLESELQRMRLENSEVRKELLTSALTDRNLSPLELEKILKKFSDLQNSSFETTKVRANIYQPRDCHDIYLNGHVTSGVYQIQPIGAPHADNVYCEMVNGTGWTVLMRRVDGSVNFVRKWADYKYGFGGQYGEFWIGNDMLHWLTSQRSNKLRIDMWDFEGRKFWAEFDTFKVASEALKYKLYVRGYSGNSGDSLSYHDDNAFSTEDADNDLFMRHCAEENKGGWWFNGCLSSNFNGIYYPQGRYGQGTGTSSAHTDGIVWYTLKDTGYYSLKRVEMKIRPDRNSDL